MNCPPNKHEITIWLDCEQFARLQDAAQFIGKGHDLENYIIGILVDNC